MPVESIVLASEREGERESREKERERASRTLEKSTLGRSRVAG